MSASTTPTRNPASAIATAILAVTVDLPTPPLPLLMAIIRGAAEVSVCVMSVSLALWLGCRCIACAELRYVNCCEFFGHAGTIGGIVRGREMTAILACPERGGVPLYRQGRGKAGQRRQEPVAFGRPKAVDHVNQVPQRVLREYCSAVIRQVKRYAAPVAVRAGARHKPLAFQRLDDL